MLNAYHGTTLARARRIFDQGLLPLPPSRLVWFAESRAYAMGRARTQARRAGDEPVVLACSLDIEAIRRRVGGRGVVHRKGIIAVDGPVTVEMMGSVSLADLATVPAEVAAWVNRLLDLAPEEAVRPSHPGVDRLSRWVNARLASGGGGALVSSELIERARRWLPERFVGAELGAKRLREHSHVGLTEFEVVEARASGADPREAEAFRRLEDPRPAERAAGISLLAETGAPDLFDWCAMFVEDTEVEVRVAALRAMLGCPDVVTNIIEPLADSPERRVRAAAISVLAGCPGGEGASWVRRGLEDPEACVRVEVARFIDRLDARRHKGVLVLASHDPNPDIAARARRRMRGGGGQGG